MFMSQNRRPRPGAAPTSPASTASTDTLAVHWVIDGCRTIHFLRESVAALRTDVHDGLVLGWCCVPAIRLISDRPKTVT